jgi:sugar-specific transcriptional regulator TrmB
MVVNDLIQHIKTLGFSEYEAKAYLCLLKIQPATAYEIAQGSGIPSSKIYEVIAKLVEKQVFMADGDEGKKRFLALMPEEFVERQRSGFTRTLDVLAEELPALKSDSPVSVIWNVGDYDLFMDKAARMVKEAEKTLLLSAWEDERLALEPLLAEAEKRGIRIASVHYGKREAGAGVLFHHPIEDTLYREKGGRGLVLVRDSADALVGTIEDGGRVHGAFSSNQGFITLAEDYIKHDIYIMKIVSRFDETLIRRFGENYKHLRNIFEDKDIP